MNSKYTISQKLIIASIFLLISLPVLVLLAPKKTNAQFALCPGPCASEPTSWIVKFFTGATSASTATSASIDVKTWAQEILKEILRATARKLLSQMTQATVNWINSGFHGSPLFVENPGSFFKDIAKSEIRDLVSIIGYDSTRYPFGKSAAISTIEGYKQTFAQNAQSSLSKVTNDAQLIRDFQTDFAVGGWDGFFLQTQFPQNNYIGFQMLYTEELARRLAGTGQNKAQQYGTILDQGQGFLSPQTCPSNPAYNNLKNEFQKPTFKCSVPPPPVVDCPRTITYICPEDKPNCTDGFPIVNRSCTDAALAQVTEWENKCRIERQVWDKTNSCPGGLVSTTPGSVVGAQIMKAITGPYDQTSLAAAMGNSLSAIFDALLNKFMSTGLNALSGRQNNTGTNGNDDFNYYGHTLGTSGNFDTGSGFNWNGPDEIINLGTFKKEVQSAIGNGNAELKLIDSDAVGVGPTPDFVSNPGLLQLLEQIFPEAQGLDMCIPGPNIGWQARVDEEAIRVTASNPSSSSSITSAAEALKTFIDSKMKSELPGSASYLNSISSVRGMSSLAAEAASRQSVIAETLVKLTSIQSELSGVTSEPSPRSSGETTLIRLRERYNSMLIDISTPGTVSTMQNHLADARDKLTSLRNLSVRCSMERTDKGWSTPGGENSKLKNSGTEKAVFCESQNTSISCDAVFKTSIADYKTSGDTPQ